MSNELPKIPTEDGKIHVLLTYVDDDPETYVHLFTSKKAVEDYVVDGIKRYWEEWRRDADYVEGYESAVDRDVQDARKCLREYGQWYDGQGNTYVYDEKEWTA